MEAPLTHERFGAVRIHDTIQVVELDSGTPAATSGTDPVDARVVHVHPDRITDGERRMAVIVPTRNERRKVIEGVLSGIPHECLVILVSASDRSPVDRFALEADTLGRFARLADRPALAVHQDDPRLATILADAGLAAMIEEGVVRRGKGEAMIVGMLLASLSGKESVGFVDADNYVPGAVHEYVKSFAAGLEVAPTPYAMVRISWQSKPKVEDGRLVFNRWGRASEVTNRFLNLVLSTYNGFGTEVITTGNAGEHAMTLELARRLRFAGGFATEPFELIELFEQFGGAQPSRHPEVMASMVDVFQVETRNPHFHEDKGEAHVDDLRLQALRILESSPICPETVREEIADVVDTATMEAPPVYPPWGETADTDRLSALLDEASPVVRLGPG